MVGEACTIVSRDGSIHCVLAQRWASAARLYVNNPSDVPDEFRLFIGQEQRDVFVFWQGRTEIGVRFKR